MRRLNLRLAEETEQNDQIKYEMESKKDSELSQFREKMEGNRIRLEREKTEC